MKESFLEQKSSPIQNLEQRNKEAKEKVILEVLKKAGYLDGDGVFDVRSFSNNFTGRDDINGRLYNVVHEELESKEISVESIDQELKNLNFSDEKIDEVFAAHHENTNPIYSPKIERRRLKHEDVVNYVCSNEFYLSKESTIKQKPFHIPLSLDAIFNEKDPSQEYLFNLKRQSLRNNIVLEDGTELLVGAQYLAINYPNDLRFDDDSLQARDFFEHEYYDLHSKEGLDRKLSDIAQWESSRKTLEETIESSEAFHKRGDILFFDKTKIATLFSEYKNNLPKVISPYRYFAQALAEVEAVDISNINEPSQEQFTPKPVLSLPTSFDETVAANFNEGIIMPWEIFGEENSETTTISLTNFSLEVDDGTVTSIGELKLAKFFRDSFVLKDSDQKLTYFDNETGERKPLDFNKTVSATYHKGTDKEKVSSISKAEFIEKLSNLYRQGMISIRGFERLFGSETYQDFGVPEKRFTAGKSANTRFYSSDDGAFGKYYFGRDTLIGTDIEAKDNLIAAQLDGKTGAIVSESFGKKVILFTFPIGKSKYFEEKLEQVKNELKEKMGREISDKEVVEGNHLRYGADYIKSIMKPYEAIGILEKPLAHINPFIKNKILSVAGDYSFITEDLREKLAPARLGIATRPWDEQMLLGSLLSYIHNEEDMVSFLKTYGKEGLNTLTSILRGGFEMGEKIIELGEQLPEKMAQEIFATYSSIVERTQNITKKIQRSIGDELDNIGNETFHFSEQISEALLTRAKDVLLSAHSMRETENSKIRIEDYLQALRGFELTLKIIEDMGKGEWFEYQRTLQNEELNRFLVREKQGDKEYEVSFLTRPYAEANNRAQARISLEVSFDTSNPDLELKKAFEQVIHYSSNDKTKEMSSMRLALDLDTSFSEDEPILSLDTGRAEFQGQKIQRTGDTLGNAFALISKDSSHVQDVFDSKFSNKEVFASVVTKLQSYLNNL